MSATVAKNMRRQRRKRGIRKRVIGTPDRPRLSVTRSHKNISAQIIDDLKGVTLCQASSLNKDLTGQLKGGGNVEAAKAVGVALAERAKSAGVAAIVFDRNGYKYHGRIKALAEAMREAGLKF